MACSFDWSLLLEFTKALAGPVATVVGAFLVARFALENFRKQKALERRLDWYERMHRSLIGTAELYQRAAYANRINDPQADEKWGEVHAEVKRLASLCDESWLYAHQSGFEAIDRMRIEILGIQREHATDYAVLARKTAEACVTTAAKLSSEIRKDLGNPDLRVHVHQDPLSGHITIRGH